MTYLPQQDTILKTLQEAFAFFADEKNAHEYAVKRRWPKGVTCPTCGSADITFLPTRTLFQCKNRHPKRQFSVKTGSIFECSPIPLGKWLLIAWMLVNCRNGISSYEAARTIGITQKSAWFMLHRLRVAMEMAGEPLTGIVEGDETYIGGKIKNKHKSARKQGRYHDKSPVFGMVERGGRVIAMAVESTKEAHLLPVIKENLSDKETVLFTDDYAVYDKLESMGLQHDTINHTQDNFLRAGIHTNTIENFWSCLKRMLGGTYIHVSPVHLNAYVQEQVFRFNHRKKLMFSEENRFANVIKGVAGKRLTYKELTAEASI